MTTAVDRFAQLTQEVVDLTYDFILNHCVVSFDPINPPGTSVIIVSGEGDYLLKLRGESAAIKQATLVARFERLRNMAEWLIKDNSVKMKLVDIKGKIAELGRVNDTELPDVAERICSAVRGWSTLLQMSLDDWSREIVYVPDTNALMNNPDLEKWTFPEHKVFTVLLLPTVLTELDILNSRQQFPDTKKKAEGVIRRIKGWRSRGRLSEGVTILSRP